MPGRNGMGPIGKGSMTGRGMGNCNPNVQNATGGRGCGMGFGRGRGAGQNENFERGCGFGFKSNNLAQPQQDELFLLKNQANLLKTNLDSINNRISELEEKE